MAEDRGKPILCPHYNSFLVSSMEIHTVIRTLWLAGIDRLQAVLAI
jgi:hypothetical protein